MPIRKNLIKHQRANTLIPTTFTRTHHPLQEDIHCTMTGIAIEANSGKTSDPSAELEKLEAENAKLKAENAQQKAVIAQQERDKDKLRHAWKYQEKSRFDESSFFFRKEVRLKAKIEDQEAVIEDQKAVIEDLEAVIKKLQSPTKHKDVEYA